jgi:transposase-like protein
MPRPACPFCSCTRSWKVRRGRRKCIRCRHEWAPGIVRIPGIRITETELRGAIRAFLLSRTSARIRLATGIGAGRSKRLAHLFRLVMSTERLPIFSGVVELDETYIGGQRKNQRLHIRKRYPPKRGHGTQKLPIFGIFHRGSGRVFVDVEPKKLDWRYVLSIVRKRVAQSSRVYTDGFPMYAPLPRLGYVHRSVDHNAHEYVRGDVHTNGIEGFWGIMKRQMGCIGGMRRDRLHLFAQEIVWRFNHRKESDETKERALLKLVLERTIGG